MDGKRRKEGGVSTKNIGMRRNSAGEGGEVEERVEKWWIGGGMWSRKGGDRKIKIIRGKV